MKNTKDKNKFSEKIHYKDMIKNRLIDEWLDHPEEENKQSEDLGDYDLGKYIEEDEEN